MRLEETPHVPVRLRLFTDDERDRLAAQEVTTAELRRERAIRFFAEAEAQDGLLTHDDVAWLVGASRATVGKWLQKHQKEEGEAVPTRGTLHDLGRGTTHKRIIVRLHLEGKLGGEIARRTRHAQKNVDRYIAGYERVRLLAHSHTREEIPALANMSPSPVAEYLALLEEFEGEAPVDATPRAAPDTTSRPLPLGGTRSALRAALTCPQNRESHPFGSYELRFKWNLAGRRSERAERIRSATARPSRPIPWGERSSDSVLALRPTAQSGRGVTTTGCSKMVSASVDPSAPTWTTRS